jgi:hypothetical protein
MKKNSQSILQPIKELRKSKITHFTFCVHVDCIMTWTVKDPSLKDSPQLWV